MTKKKKSQSVDVPKNPTGNVPPPHYNMPDLETKSHGTFHVSAVWQQTTQDVRINFALCGNDGEVQHRFGGNVPDNVLASLNPIGSDAHKRMMNNLKHALFVCLEDNVDDFIDGNLQINPVMTFILDSHRVPVPVPVSVAKQTKPAKSTSQDIANSYWGGSNFSSLNNQYNNTRPLGSWTGKVDDVSIFTPEMIEKIYTVAGHGQEVAEEQEPPYLKFDLGRLHVTLEVPFEELKPDEQTALIVLGHQTDISKKTVAAQGDMNFLTDEDKKKAKNGVDAAAMAIVGAENEMAKRKGQFTNQTRLVTNHRMEIMSHSAHRLGVHVVKLPNDWFIVDFANTNGILLAEKDGRICFLNVLAEEKINHEQAALLLDQAKALEQMAAAYRITAKGAGNNNGNGNGGTK